MENNAAAGEDLAAGSAPPPPATGRILVKLKLPKMADSGELKRHCCPDCDRSFSSGKALGGHMSSAHVQTNKDQALKKLKAKTNSNRRASTSAAAAAAEIVCTECSRSFPSMKALFGHMRCHPERKYRGMNSTKPRIGPSPNPNLCKLGGNQGDDKSGPQDEAGMGESDPTFKPWSMTGKRGRASQEMKSPSPPSVSSTEEEEVFDALVMLHRGDVGASRTKKKLRISQGDNSKLPKAPLRIQSEEEEEIGVCLSAMFELMQGRKDLEGSNPNQKHTCTICDRTFSTHQALKGHISSHTKLEMNIVNPEDEYGKTSTMTAATTTSVAMNLVMGATDHQAGGAEKSSSSRASSSSLPHVCKICKRGFGCGHPLGGDMRSHGVLGEDEDEKKKVVMDFDLNKMPDEVDDM